MSKFVTPPHPSGVRRPLGGLLDRLRRRVTRTRLPDDQPVPARMRRRFSPSVRALEPRFVLNATAELNALGQLLITGTSLAETVQVDVDSSGDVSLTDELDQVIPIAGHPSDPNEPLNVSDIGAGQIVVQLGGGDDILKLQIPDGLDVTVIDGEGTDRTVISPADHVGVDMTNQIRIESDFIEFDPSVQTFGPGNFGLSNDSVRLTGDVVIGNTVGQTVVDLGASDIAFDGNVSFIGDVVLRADQTSFGNGVNVTGDSVALVEAPVTDELLGRAGIVKTGSGTLVLDAENPYTGNTEVREGTLFVGGEIQSTSELRVLSGATLKGDGVAGGQVVVDTGGNVSPELRSSLSAGLPQVGSLHVDQLDAAPSSVLSFDIDGPRSDQIIVASQTRGEVSIDQSILNLNVSGNIEPATEFVLIDNDGVDPIQGRFRVLFDVDGTALPQGRILTDGATVLDSFGSSNQAAHITYFGGDGNDVTIVTAGGFDVVSAGVTIVSRQGVNLEIRTGTSFATASTNTPIIRPILGRDDSTVRIVGSAADDVLFVDVDGFFDAAPGAVNFTGSLVFDAGESTGDDDQLRIIDSSGASDILTGSVDYEYFRHENGSIDIAPGSNLDPLRLRFDDVEHVNQEPASNRVGIQLASSDDRVRLTTDPDDETQTRFETESDGISSTSISIANPNELLRIRACAGQDTIVVDGLGRGFGASMQIDGEQEDDSVILNADMTLGSDTVPGNLAVDAESISVNARIETTGGGVDGNLVLRASESMVVTGLLRSGSGNLVLVGGGGSVDTSDATLIADGVIEPIQIVDASSVRVGDVVAPNGSLVIGVAQNVTGNVSQASGTSLDVNRLSLSTVGDISLNNAENTIDTIEQIVTQGDVQIRNGGGDLLVQSIATSEGSVALSNLAGSVRLQAVAADNGSIAVSADGVSSDILVGKLVAGNGGDVRLDAGDDVLSLPMPVESIVVADDLVVNASNQTADQNEAIRLTTNVNDLSAVVAGAARGDITIDETDSIRLASSDDGNDAEKLQTSNGEINVRAGNSVVITDFDASNDGDDRSADREVVAGGENGRISIAAAVSLRLGDAVQMSASRSDVAAVTLQAPAIEFGSDVEINTGEGVGIARVFSPRPEDRDPIDPNDPNRLLPRDTSGGPSTSAFFDPESVTTNKLTQANINDAIGILTVDIGQSGERGLTVNIDWGTESERFQQIDNVHADDALIVRVGSDVPEDSVGDAVLRVEHFYLEEDILASRLNGRESETDPINVRFSVRHHESILVQGNTVSQGSGEVEPVPDGIVSSTDNDNPLVDSPLSELTFQNGRAAFIIPPLSIPVAFFPVRDVIPEIEQPEVFVRRDASVFLPQTNLQSTESSASSTTVRDEYLQIRMLSPEPGGEDLAPPERLPDDILDGNKLQQLFSKLPDGTYEIEYVLGDGNERLILHVDLRNGRPVVPGDDTEGGTLRLMPLDDSADEESERILRLLDEEEPEVDGDDPASGQPAETRTRQQRESTDTTAPTQDNASTKIDTTENTESTREVDASALVVFGALARRSNRVRVKRRSRRFSVARRMVARSERHREMH